MTVINQHQEAEATADENLLHHLHELQPKSLLVVGDALPNAVQAWAAQHHSHVTHLDSQQPWDDSLGRHDLAIVMDYLEHKDKTQARERLGQIRNLYSEHIWVAVADDQPWSMNDFIGLGFHQLGHYETGDSEPDVTCYGYDLATYNHVRPWNNSRYWANPENWGKYRW